MARVQLAQRTAALATPVGPPIELALADDEDTVAVVRLPAVERESDFELRVEARSSGGEWQSLGRVALRLYPEDLLAPLRSWAATRSLRVVEEDGRLGALLRGFDIPFRARGSRPIAGRSTDRVTLYAGRHARDADGAGFEPSAVVFAETERGVPHLVVTEAPGGRIVRVEIELLERLDSDPRAQKTFLEIFELLEPRDIRS